MHVTNPRGELRRRLEEYGAGAAVRPGPARLAHADARIGGGSSSKDRSTLCSQLRRRKAISRLKRSGCRQRGLSIVPIVAVGRCARGRFYCA
jgi:hypothetical protein